jgi:hypothetical protein
METLNNKNVKKNENNDDIDTELSYSPTPKTFMPHNWFRDKTIEFRVLWDSLFTAYWWTHLAIDFNSSGPMKPFERSNFSNIGSDSPFSERVTALVKRE